MIFAYDAVLVAVP